MSSSEITIRLEKPQDAESVETLIENVFGPGMFTRAAYALREGVAHEPQLAFVAELDGEIIGSVRQTAIGWGNQTAWMLGPLGVSALHKNKGIGRKLLTNTVDAAKALAQTNGPNVIILVGDFDYYAPNGFKRIAPDKITLPRPVDPTRVLACELVEDAVATFEGPATRVSG